MSFLVNMFGCQRVLVNVKTLVISDNLCALTSVFMQNIQTRNIATKRRRGGPPGYWMKQKSGFLAHKFTPDNLSFIKKTAEEKMANLPSLLKDTPWQKGEWHEGSRRAGLIGKKIGIYPMWKKDGTRILATLIHFADNHVIRYIPPEVYVKTESGKRFHGKFGSLVVGAESANPIKFTNEYQGLFREAGVAPTLKLTRFTITANAAIQPGTPLSIAHFRVGDYVDIFGKTIDHGFQGVMKRWGMKGGPATHGTTKAHRRVGSIGTGRQMARVWKGKKMPGHMGRERRTHGGVQILRINYKHNVMWVRGPGIPGHVHRRVCVFDTGVLAKKSDSLNIEPPPFPTYYPEDHDKPLPEEVIHPDLHDFSEGSLTFADEPEIIIEPIKIKGRRK